MINNNQELERQDTSTFFGNLFIGLLFDKSLGTFFFFLTKYFGGFKHLSNQKRQVHNVSRLPGK